MYNHKTHAIVASVKKEATELSVKSVLIALSGGADSTATAFALKNSGLQVKALHCNFHLRGEESDRDENFVRSFCSSHEIPLSITDFDVPSYIEKHPGTSVEMACRNLRHDWFKDQLINTGFDRIATGHNADDNIETFLINMLRGCGTRGLRGMEKDNLTIWRPLLSFHRAQILEFLNHHKISYVVDSTNLESDFRRNFLRNKVIPLIKEEWRGFNSALDKTISNIASENKIVESTIEEILREYKNHLPVEKIVSFPAPLLLIKRFIEILGPFSKTPREVFDSINANKPHIRRWRLRNGMLILHNGELFIEMSHCESRS